jgi:hypothetical protein
VLVEEAEEGVDIALGGATIDVVCTDQALYEVLSRGTGSQHRPKHGTASVYGHVDRLAGIDRYYLALDVTPFERLVA